MQNKGAIRLFAILLALACAYYLMFTYVANGIEKEAKAYAENYVETNLKNNPNGKTFSTEKERQAYIDSAVIVKTNSYLDSLKKKPVYNLGVAQYTYEDVTKSRLNLGLDLKGGMNVTLEVSVAEIIRSLSNDSNDPAFIKALGEAQKLQPKSTKDFVTLFGEQYLAANPNGKLALNFQTIELKGKVDFNTSNEDVLKFLRERVNEAIETSENTLRTRIDKFGVTQPTIQRLASSGRLLIELPGVTDKDRVRKLLQGTANLEFWETYDNSEIAPLFPQVNDIIKASLASSDTTKKSDTALAATAVKPVIDSINKAKDSTASLASQLNKPATTADSTKLSKGKEDQAKENPFFAVLTPAFEYRDKKPVGPSKGPVVGYAVIKDTAKVNRYLSNPKVKALFPPRTKFLWTFKALDKEETAYQLLAIKGNTNANGQAPLAGDIITDARKEFEPGGGGSPHVTMQMTAEAAQVWKRITHDNIGKCVAIVLDNYVYSFPYVRSEISGGSGTQIEGNFTIPEADDLVTILKAGKLPAQARIVQETVVGPTLGEEAIKDGLLSTVIALVLVLLFMGFYYSKAGWVADFAMIVNNFFVLGILASFHAVLTLPGIAGIVLTIAMSVDANILIFERVREELNVGKGTALAIKEGYKNAMPSIIDGHVTTLLLGVILFVFGTGPLQGFATTLIIGIISSLFCAIFITRLIFDRWLGKNKAIPFGNKLTEHAFKKININFVAKRKLYYVFSGIIIIAGIAAYVSKGGFTLGVDFKGGRSYVVRFNQAQPVEDVRKALEVSFGQMPEVKTYGENRQQRITTTYLIDDASSDAEQKVEAKLMEGLAPFGVTKSDIMSSNKVGETVSRDIRSKAVWAILLSCLVMFVFIFIRFKKWQYGLGAVIALFHDVAIVLSVYILLDGILPFLEITQDFIAAILTVMSYSMTDTVVVFDRVREYLTERNKSDLDKTERVKVINYALNSTLSRTINTSLTIFFVLLAIFVFGGETIKGFSFALLIGIVIGTYSSICIATPIVIDLEPEKALDKKLAAEKEVAKNAI
ncbi:MAG TPA: protein translocase subunit SecDF [Bacteroidia bacterium]|jgi:SecD/SecF fusion protein|nr:protein translocase subunit SecDF [Bacteroidia bacterium]